MLRSVFIPLRRGPFPANRKQPPPAICTRQGKPKEARESAEEAERELRLRVRLAQDRGRGLLEDRVAGQVRGLHGDVHVADPALRGTRRLAHVGEGAERALEAVLLRAERASTAATRAELEEMSEAARAVGAALGATMMEKGIKTAVFDRGGFVYHGRVKAVAEACREAGVEF